MLRLITHFLLFAAVAMLAILRAPDAAGHATFVRSEPAAGSTLPASPESIRIWFAEPLEPSYTRAVLLDTAGQQVAGVSSKVDSQDSHQLVLSLPPNLPKGDYTVSWRNLSAADGHSLEGYFGFRIGEGGPAASSVASSSMSGNEAWRAITRWLAILGLAALIAVGPVMLLVVGPSARLVPALGTSLPSWLRRYGVVAIVLALLGSALALAAQAASIAPDAPLAGAILGTLRDTRYGQLWLARMGLLLVCVLAVGVAVWGKEERRRPALVVATLVGILAPLPFSLLSHAAAQNEGQAAAVAADALHLLSASVWAGGLLILVFVFLPASRRLASEEGETALLTAIPRFSVIGLAAWGMLLLSGLYASWLQVGTIEALRETDYGRTLLLKGALLLPALALATYHYRLGWRGSNSAASGRTARTLAAEAVFTVGVLLVVGRLIGLEPAREVVSGQAATALTMPLTFGTNEGERSGTLAISPGAVGTNTFTLKIAGAPLPDGSEGVLRFSLPSAAIGEQELRLPQAGAKQFQADGPELSLAGEWHIETIVRKIGSFSWASQGEINVGATPPVAPEPNPAPHFDTIGAVAMVIIALGLSALAAGVVRRDHAARWRSARVVAGLLALAGGAIVLAGSRLPPMAEGLAATSVAGTPPASTPPTGVVTVVHHDHSAATPMAKAAQAAAPGTPVTQDGLTATLELAATASGPAEVTVRLSDDAGGPMTGARVAVVSEMAGMGKDETTAAEVAPGRYVASGVPLSMSGEWRLLVRVSPKGEATHIFIFTVRIP